MQFQGDNIFVTLFVEEITQIKNLVIQERWIVEKIKKQTLKITKTFLS